MVATAMEGYAKKLGLPDEEIITWWTAGLLHDLDWEKYPDEHPNYAVNNILLQKGYSEMILNAIKAHAPDRTGKNPESEIEKYLFACDELSGFINAASLVRPSGLADMEAKSVVKRLKDKRFAANVNREDIYKGVELIGLPLNDHISNLISFFKEAGY
jgi:predicted hydrolase (HD superfamily)